MRVEKENKEIDVNEPRKQDQIKTFEFLNYFKLLLKIQIKE